MTKPATLHDVAALAGVSIKTVSRVVNGTTTVRADVRDRVLAAVAELQYVPNSFARSLKMGSGDTVGVIIDTIADPFFASLTHAVEARALEAGLNVIFGSTGFTPERERRQVERMAMQRVEALILAPVSGSHAYLEPYRRSFPIVLIDRSIEIEGFDVVAVDDRGITRRAIDHLLEHGHRKIAFVGSDARFPTTVARLLGYEESLAAAGIAVRPGWVRPGPTVDVDAADVVAEMLAEDDQPTAIFAANPRAAVGVAHALHTADRADIAFISFGDFPLAKTLRPAVTYVDQDPEAIGVAAIERVLTHLEAKKLRRKDPTAEIPEDEPRTIIVDTDIVERGSGEVAP